MPCWSRTAAVTTQAVTTQATASTTSDSSTTQQDPSKLNLLQLATPAKTTAQLQVQQNLRGGSFGQRYAHQSIPSDRNHWARRTLTMNRATDPNLQVHHIKHLHS